MTLSGKKFFFRHASYISEVYLAYERTVILVAAAHLTQQKLRRAVQRRCSLKPWVSGRKVLVYICRVTTWLWRIGF